MDSCCCHASYAYYDDHGYQKMMSIRTIIISLFNIKMMIMIMITTTVTMVMIIIKATIIVLIILNEY